MELEICSIQDQTDEDKKAGRVKIIMSAHEIYSDENPELYNKNGIHWSEKYTNNNIKSAIGAPFVVRFLDDERTQISDHGRMENDLEDGSLVFPDSDTVGHVEKAWVEEKTIENETRKVLMFEGVLYDHRYHSLVKELRNIVSSGDTIKGSVEIVGKGDAQQIEYEHGFGAIDSNGNLVMGRVPKVYDYSALCILGQFVEPADDSSRIVELNQKSNQVSQTDDSVDIKNNSSKEDSQMGDKNVDASVIELNNKIVELTTEVNNLKQQINEKDAEINSCNKEITSLKEKETELNKCQEELTASKEKETELNSLLVEANKTVEAQKNQIAELNTEIEPLRQMKADADAKSLQAEVNAYFETIKKENGFSEAELNSLKTDFVDKCDLDGLKAKETELCVNKFKEMKKAEVVDVEVNSSIQNSDNLFFSTKAEIVNNNDTTDGSELFK